MSETTSPTLGDFRLELKIGDVLVAKSHDPKLWNRTLGNVLAPGRIVVKLSNGATVACDTAEEAVALVAGLPEHQR